MSHSLGTSSTAMAMTTVVIANYTAGGEQFTLAEFSAVGYSSSNVNDFMLPGLIPAGNNSLGVVLFPVLSAAGVVQLFKLTGGAFAEIPTTAGLNASFPVLMRAA
jgi:hypothetical protein